MPPIEIRVLNLRVSGSRRMRRMLLDSAIRLLSDEVYRC